MEKKTKSKEERKEGKLVVKCLINGLWGKMWRLDYETTYGELAL